MEINKLNQDIYSREQKISKRPLRHSLLDPRRTREGGSYSTKVFAQTGVNKEKSREDFLSSHLEQSKQNFSNQKTPNESNGKKEEVKKINNQLTTQKQKHTFLKVGLGFFGVILACGIGYGIYVYMTKLFSLDRLTLSFDAPEFVKAGEDFDFKVMFHNNNRVNLKNCTLSLSFSEVIEVVKTEKDIAKSDKGLLLFDLGNIEKGGNGNINFGAKIIKKEQALPYIDGTLACVRGDNNKPVTQKNKQGIRVEASKISFQMEATRQAASGDLIEYLLKFTNETGEVINNPEIHLAYPENFSFSEASIAPANEANDLFKFPNLQPGELYEIVIKGTLKGISTETKRVVAQIGVVENNKFIVMAEEKAEVKMATSPLFIEQEILASSSDKTTGSLDPGNSLRVKVKYRNMSEVAMRDAIVSVDIEGKVIDFNSFKIENGGSLDSNEQKIIWRASNNSPLSVLDPKEEGEVFFEFKTIDRIPSESLEDKNFEFTLSAQIDSPDVPTPIGANKIISSDKKSIKLNTKVFFEVKGFYNDMAIPNEGPIPPRSEEETTYTIHWKIININNDLTDVVVRTSIPEYAVWKKNFFPKNEEVSFNERTKEIVWNVKKIPALTGTQLETKELVFQIGIIPQKHHIGEELLILNKSTMSGKDSFTGKEYSLKVDELDTMLQDDQGVGFVGGRVEKGEKKDSEENKDKDKDKDKD